MLSCNNRISLHCTAHFSVRTNESEKKEMLESIQNTFVYNNYERTKKKHYSESHSLFAVPVLLKKIFFLLHINIK